MLHLIFQSPIEYAVLERIASGDDVIFLENAVLGLLQKNRLGDVLARLLDEGCELFVLADDMAARGLKVAELPAGVAVVGYQAFVALTVKNAVIQSWS